MILCGDNFIFAYIFISLKQYLIASHLMPFSYIPYIQYIRVSHIRISYITHDLVYNPKFSCLFPQKKQ